MSNFPEVLNFNRLFLKLHQFISWYAPHSLLIMEAYIQ